MIRHGSRLDFRLYTPKHECPHCGTRIDWSAETCFPCSLPGILEAARSGSARGLGSIVQEETWKEVREGQSKWSRRARLAREVADEVERRLREDTSLNEHQREGFRRYRDRLLGTLRYSQIRLRRLDRE